MIESGVRDDWKSGGERRPKPLISNRQDATWSKDTTGSLPNPAFRDEMNELVRAHALTGHLPDDEAELNALRSWTSTTIRTRPGASM